MQTVSPKTYFWAKVSLAFFLIYIASFIWALTSGSADWAYYVGMALVLIPAGSSTHYIWHYRKQRRPPAAIVEEPPPLRLPLLPWDMRDPAWDQARIEARSRFTEWVNIYTNASRASLAFSKNNLCAQQEDYQRFRRLQELLMLFPKEVKAASLQQERNKMEEVWDRHYTVNRTYHLYENDRTRKRMREGGLAAGEVMKRLPRYIEQIETILPEMTSVNLSELHVPRLMKAIADCPAGHVTTHFLEATDTPGRVRRTCTLCDPVVTWTEET